MADRRRIGSSENIRRSAIGIHRPKALHEVLAQQSDTRRPNREEIDRQLNELARLIAGASDQFDDNGDK